MRARHLDEIDRAILDVIQSDASTTLEAIGSVVGLSAAAVQRRVQRHRSSGLISGSCTLLEPSAAGVPILVLTVVTLERDTVAVIDSFGKRVAAHPNVQQCYELAGRFDLALLVVAPDMETYRHVVGELLDEDPNVARYSSHVTLRSLKRTLKLPVRG